MILLGLFFSLHDRKLFMYLYVYLYFDVNSYSYLTWPTFSFTLSLLRYVSFLFDSVGVLQRSVSLSD
jgi:hypothetical protein